MKLVITGAAGMLGTHIRAFFEFHSKLFGEVVAIDRAGFNDPRVLDRALAGAAVVIHCAGVNRAAPDEVRHANRIIAEHLVNALKRADFNGVLVYTNSTHSSTETDYGVGKQEASDHFAGWAKSVGGSYVDLVLPHVFGEFGRPEYNSVVHTFANNLAASLELVVNGDGKLELMHGYQVAKKIEGVLENKEFGRIRADGVSISVRELAERMTYQHSSYTAGIVPDVREDLDLHLFNVIRSFLFPRYYPVELTLHEDNRGGLFEAEKNLSGGQTFLSTTKPGITRGNHFHFKKIERFLVIGGRARISLRPIYGNEVISFEVSGDKPAYIDMPTFHTHKIENIGDDEVTTLFWSHEIFDPSSPDTYALDV